MTEAKSNLRILVSAKASNSGPRSISLNSMWTALGGAARMTSTAPALATIGMLSGSSSFPYQWSPFPWVLNAWPIGCRR